jgi:acyl-[acyl-carrier-protein] desaturase
MADAVTSFPPELEAAFWRMFREFFNKAERRRRWNIEDDIPWDQCNPKLNPAVADVVESFTAVELYLPDYQGKILPVVRKSKGRAWFYANWGYEESKHSMALGDWLLKSGHRTEEQMADLETKVFEYEWNLPHDSHMGMLIYAMVQEHATFVNYRNLKQRAAEGGGDPALETLLRYVSVDEKAHHSFFRDGVKLWLDYDRDATLEQMRRVMNNFAMPAIHDLIGESQKRIEQIRRLEIFTETIYYSEVYLPILADLGIDRREMRNRLPDKKSQRA